MPEVFSANALRPYAVLAGPANPLTLAHSISVSGFKKAQVSGDEDKNPSIPVSYFYVNLRRRRITGVAY
jgi:hypothetical protein